MYTVLLHVSEAHAWTFGLTPTVQEHRFSDWPAWPSLSPSWKRAFLEEVFLQCSPVIGEA